MSRADDAGREAAGPDPSLVRGWCPGARRPMATGDGLLVRLRISGGIVPAALAGAIADLAESFGNGLVDLSQRGNLQLRGVEQTRLDALLTRLDALGVLDADAEAESIRNIVASPLAGYDPTAPVDGRALVAALERELAADAMLRRLPAKFGFAVDDGGRLGLDDVDVDVHLIGVAGENDPCVLLAIADRPGRRRPLARLRSDAAAARAADVARAVVRLRAGLTDAPRRLHEIVARAGLAAFLDAAGLTGPVGEIAAPPPRPHGGDAVLGDHTAEPGAFLGVGAPFGRFTARQIARLGEIAATQAAGEIRLTPWRAVAIPGIAPDAVADIRTRLAAEGCVVSPDDPRRAVVTCAGATGCRNASRDTRADAEALAGLAHGLAAKGLALHVSGCEKGCAHPGPAPWTLTARGGAYDLVRDGRAWDRPLRAGLTPAEAASVLADPALH